MVTEPIKRPAENEHLLMGDEAVALGAVHAGLTAAYAYPGTPSTEAFEFLLCYAQRHGHPHASWCANEKTAYEQALGVSMVGRRSLVVMKHVGLNVAADPFINSAIVSVHGGLVLVVADDPGMHSSQNEQDSRFYADFARIVCLEPANQQEAYEMTREAFEISERFQIPVLLRLVTRLAHSRSIVRASQSQAEKPLDKARDPSSWTLLPANARKLWRRLLDLQPALERLSEDSPFNALELSDVDMGLGVITTGIARGYLRQNLPDLGFMPSRLHLGAYPIPRALVRALAQKCDRILVLEEGYPLVERGLRGLLPEALPIAGKESGEVPLAGELTPESVRQALGLPPTSTPTLAGVATGLPPRPPQLSFSRPCPTPPIRGAGGTDIRRAAPAAGRWRRRSPAAGFFVRGLAGAQTTMFTILSGTTMIRRGSLPARAFSTTASLRTAAIISSFSRSVATAISVRRLPLICTGSTISLTASRL